MKQKHEYCDCEDIRSKDGESGEYMLVCVHVYKEMSLKIYFYKSRKCSSVHHSHFFCVWHYVTGKPVLCNEYWLFQILTSMLLNYVLPNSFVLGDDFVLHRSLLSLLFAL